MLGLILLGIALIAVAAVAVYNALSGAANEAKTDFSHCPPDSPVQSCPLKLAAAHPEIIGAAQAKRGQEKLARQTPEDKRRFEKLLEDAKSDEERAYLWKAFAACHSVDECSKFADKIRGKDATWLRDNLQLTSSSTGSGVQQQWSHSCNSTTAQALRGQMDPVYALKMHEDNPEMGLVDGDDATAWNPNLAADQKSMLQSTYSGAAAGAHSGVAAGRTQSGGSGRWGDDLFNKSSDATGVTYKTSKDPTPSQAVEKIDKGLATGAPVPIVIGNGPGQYTHYVMVVSSNPGPPKTYLIHDPWSGTTVTRNESDIRNGTLNIAGSNSVTAVEEPTPLPADAPAKAGC